MVDQEVWIDESRPLRVSFDTHGWRFHPGARGIVGTPAEAFLRLVAVRGDTREVVEGVAGLRGRVALSTPEQALELVRLFTLPATHYLFPDSRRVEPAPADGAPGPARYTADYAAKVGIRPASARREGDGFVVERALLEAGGALVHARERVAADGAYALEEARTLDPRSPIVFPAYE